jgi:hypothetical protein
MLRSGGMGNILISLILTLCCGFRSRASLLAENLALRHYAELGIDVINSRS